MKRRYDRQRQRQGSGRARGDRALDERLDRLLVQD